MGVCHLGQLVSVKQERLNLWNEKYRNFKLKIRRRNGSQRSPRTAGSKTGRNTVLQTVQHSTILPILGAYCH